MTSQETRFYLFKDLRWIEGDDVIVLKLEGRKELLCLRRSDFSPPGKPAVDKYSISIAEDMEAVGLTEGKSRHAIALDGPLALAMYDWLGWPIPEPRRIRAA